MSLALLTLYPLTLPLSDGMPEAFAEDVYHTLNDAPPKPLGRWIELGWSASALKQTQVKKAVTPGNWRCWRRSPCKGVWGEVPKYQANGTPDTPKRWSPNCRRSSRYLGELHGSIEDTDLAERNISDSQAGSLGGFAGTLRIHSSSKLDDETCQARHPYHDPLRQWSCHGKEQQCVYSWFCSQFASKPWSHIPLHPRDAEPRVCQYCYWHFFHLLCPNLGVQKRSVLDRTVGPSTNGQPQPPGRSSY